MGESDKLLEHHIFTITVQSPLSCFITVLGVCCVLIVPAVSALSTLIMVSNY